MYVLVHICSLLLIFRFVEGQSHHGLSIMFKGVTYNSNEVIPLTSVGEGMQDGVICMTTRTDCCTDLNNEMRNGEWYYPNETIVPTNGMMQDFYRNRRTQQVILNRRNSAMSPTGCFCCEFDTPTESICITLSPSINSMSECEPVTSSTPTTVTTTMAPITTTESPPTFPPLMVTITGGGGTFTAGQTRILTCQVSGGDSTITTSYQWLKNDQDINGQTSSTLSFSPLREANTGQYNCRGARGSSTSTSGDVVITVNVPTFSVTISSSGQSTEGQDYVLTCNVNGAGSLSASISYRWDRVGGRSGTYFSQQLTFNPLRRSDGGQYRCTVIISSPYLTGTRSPTNTRTITVTRVEPGAISGLSVTARTATSISITWTQTTNIFIDRFEVAYSYTVGRCSAPPGASRTDSISDGTMRSHTLSNLDADSEYTITVRAINDVGSSMATTRATTDTSAPSASPTSVTRVTVGVTDVTIQWGEVNCADRNGAITGYKVRHGLSSTAASERIITNSNTRMFSANRLLIRSTYSFEVAAVAGGRAGPYSSVLEVTTSVPTGLGFNLKGELYSNNSIVTITDIGSGTNALYCFTNRSGCCRFEDGGINGEWFLPNRNQVDGNGRLSTLDFSRNRGPSAVLLNRRNNAMGPIGLYRCEVLDVRDIVQSIYVGLYISNRGAPSVSMLSYSHSSRTLTCVSTGGPATSVTWMKDGVSISPSSPSHQQSQRVVDTTTATYHNLLSITSSDIRDNSGSFTCTVSNTRGNSQPMSRDISAISITGNRPYQIGETTRITCSSVVGNVMIQWLRGSNVVAQMSGVQHLPLNITVDLNTNNTEYMCRVTVMDPPMFRESSPITIQVGGANLPRVPNMIKVMSITETAVTVQWSFSSPISQERPETYTVLYGTSPDELMMSTPIFSDPNMQRYTQMLGSLQPGTMYYIEIQSRNAFATRTTSDMTNFKTMDRKSSVVRSVSVTSQGNGTLSLTWQPPDSSGGTILNYTVQIIPKNNETTRREMSTTTMFSATNLTRGVPYNVTIWANNLAGQGAVASSTYFFEELVPNVAPKNISVVRTSHTTISVTWTLLTLIEARGFIRYYSVSYTPNTNGRKRQASLETMYVNVSNASTSATITGLEQSLTYNVQVAAATSAGIGVQSPPSVAKIFPTPDSNVAGIAAGVVVALVVVVIIIVIAIIILMTYRRRKERQFSPAHSKSESIRFSKPKKAPPTAPKKKKVGKAVDSNDEEKDLDDQYYENTVFIVKDRFKPVPIEDFGEHVQRMHADRDKWFELEYNAVEKSPQADYNVAQIPENRARNRFGNIFPYDFNRVVLKTVSGVEHSDYINASYVDGYQRKNVYIGAQGPVENSVEDFWRMVWEQHCPTIVMLTRIFEGRKKCEEYWPKSADEPYVPGPGSPLCIKLNSTLPFAEFDLRKMTVTSEDEPNASPLKVTMFHYMAWPDHGVPANAVSMINFIRRVRKTHPYSNEDLLLVHCSAGVGRTGTFITLDYMLERIKRERNINIYEFVCNLRKQRVLMVQTPAQYVFIHNALDELITCGETEIAAANMRIVIGKLSRTNQSGTETGYHKQYEILEKITSEIKSVDFSNAMSEPNIPKNRYKDKIPYNHTRIRLRPSAAQGSDYINASFVEGYRQKGAYIATQGPLPHTVNDFWRMIWEQEVKCIVMLCRTEEKGEEVCRQFWPLGRGSSENFDKYTVSLTSQQNTNDYVIRKMEILENQTRMSISQSGFTVTLFQYLRWPEDGVPQMTTPVLEIANLVQKVQMGSGNKAIVVMCNDGVGRTGAFITMHAQMERMKAEAVVDIFQFIKAIRVQRAGLVSTKGQYEFCHQVLADFLDGFDTYANFKEII